MLKTQTLRATWLIAAWAVTAAASAQAPSPTGPAIEVCFVLDTTGSMAGLVEGAKKKIWAIAGEIARLEPRPNVSFCLVGFRDRGDEYVTRLTRMSVDMDTIYAELTAFVAKGGGDTPEAVHQALFETLTKIHWSPGDDVIKVIYLVGDAPPHTDYADEPQLDEILALAKNLGIVVNAIQCGEHADTTRWWRAIAAGATGHYARVPQTGNVRVLRTPQDQDFVALQAKLSATLLPYGDAARRQTVASTRQRMAEADPSVVADRLSFLSRVDKALTGEGDLIADLSAGRVALDALHDEDLPGALRNLTPSERVAFLDRIKDERAQYRSIIEGLIAERQLYLKINQPNADDSFDREVIAQIKALAAARGFVLN